MARLFQDLISGVTTDSPLTDVATTFNSTALADLIEVTGSDFIAVTLDPEAEGGTPEIAHVTAHTASATSATISRGEEGTTAREHAAGTKWIAALTADAIEELEAAIAAPHGSDHATDGVDDLGAEITGYIKTGLANLVPTLMGASPTWADLASITFTKPASWNTYEIVAWGGLHSTFPTSHAGTLEIRISIDGDTAGGAVIADNAGGSGMTAGHMLTGQTDDVIARIQGRENGAGAMSGASWVAYLAIRTS